MSYVVRRVPKQKDQAPDQVVSSYQRIADWVRINMNAVVYTGGAVVFVLLLVLGILWIRENRERAASEALASAVLSLNAAGLPTSLSSLEKDEVVTPAANEADALAASKRDLEAALENFRKVASEHGGGTSGLSARLYEANILFRLERYKEAAAALEQLAAKAPGFAVESNSDYLLAASYEALKDYPKAVGTLSHLLDRAHGDFKAAVMVDLARCLELSGDVDRAVALLQDVVKEHPETPSATKADRRLALLGSPNGRTP